MFPKIIEIRLKQTILRLSVKTKRSNSSDLRPQQYKINSPLLFAIEQLCDSLQIIKKKKKSRKLNLKFEKDNRKRLPLIALDNGTKENH